MFCVETYLKKTEDRGIGVLWSKPEDTGPFRS